MWGNKTENWLLLEFPRDGNTGKLVLWSWLTRCLHRVDTPLSQTWMVNDSYLPSAVHKLPPSKSLLSASPISYVAPVSFPKYVSIRTNWVSPFSPFMLTRPSLIDADWRALRHKTACKCEEGRIEWYGIGSRSGQVVSSPALLYAEDANQIRFALNHFGKRKKVQSYFIISRINNNLMWLRRLA